MRFILWICGVLSLEAFNAIRNPVRLTSTTTIGTNDFSMVLSHCQSQHAGYSVVHHCGWYDPKVFCWQRKRHSARTVFTSTQLNAFLPPTSDDGNQNKSDVGQLVTAAFTFFGLLAFFLSPLGKILFAFLNSLVLLSILIPVGGFLAFQVWKFFNTMTGSCPNCAAPVTVPKDGSRSLCLNCGAVVQARDDNIYISSSSSGSSSSINNPVGFWDIQDPISDKADVSPWFNELGGIRQNRQPGTTTTTNKSTRSNTTTTIIDVEVVED